MPEVAVGCELTADRPTVLESLDDEREADVLGKRPWGGHGGSVNELTASSQLVTTMRAMPHPRRSLRRSLALLVVASGAAMPLNAAADSAATAASGDLTVFAAASLTDAFRSLGEAFSAEYPDVEVVFSFAASSTLANQVTDGAPTDVYASADLANMDRLVESWSGDLALEPQVFAANELLLAVEAGNPLSVGGVTDLADNPDWIFVTCAPEVPIGAYTVEMFANAGLVLDEDVDVDSYEANVRDVRAKVELGEADAGVVYATDVFASDHVDGIEIPAEWNVLAEYPIVAITEPGELWVEFVLSDAGQEILAEYGFSSPDAGGPTGSEPVTTGSTA